MNFVYQVYFGVICNKTLTKLLIDFFSTDVTLADFANSSCSRGRLRKAATHCLVREGMLEKEQ